ncbi:hypothetical protein KNO15_03400 [Leifsonia shinshuensis]|uniref:hypothetical protein n=1 Tax=Leifsonia shinshuensis TaxID=150026 RepID=UPI001F513071|nr:hypothetical protein [Leifsonia shinshuensis]MCI0155740.1 hypothetical protein [Leifsonia shinshuensis]
MAKNPGERLFERYLSSLGYELIAYEPTLGTVKRPDYLIRAAGHEVVVEVESFGSPAPPAGSSADRIEPISDRLRSVRNRISAGAAQLKGISDRPLVVVLANPEGSPVPLEPPMVMSAMYGDLNVAFHHGGGTNIEFGRNGRLHVAESSGSSRGNHPYLSAVAVLRFNYAADAHTAARIEAQSMGYTNPLAILREANRILHERGEAYAESICLDVFESLSESAVPLPPEVFSGPYDTRWGKLPSGGYGQRS